MEMEARKPSKVIFITDVPENLLDRRVMRQHFTKFGTVRRVSIDKESACCSVCFITNEAAHKAFLEGTVIDNYKLKIMLGTSGPSLNEKTEPLRDTHTYDDLDMNYLDDNNDVFDVPDLDETHSEKELFKMKKKIIRKLHKEKSDSPKETVKRVRKFSTDGDQSKVVKRSAVKSSKIFKKSSSASMTSEELSKVRSLKNKYETLELRDKLYREKLKATKVNVKGGTCPDMCPEKERIMRAYRKLWTPYEQRPGTNRLAPELAVKEYSRSSANQEEPLPHELRPEPVLNMTMNYLVLNIMPTIELADINVSQWYDFLWDRLRGIRKDIVQQQLCSVNTANILEQCARFHILCFDRLCGEDASIFDEKINTENLNNCLQSLIHMYDDLHVQGLVCPNEPEFRAYEILLKLNRGDIIWEFQQLSPNLQTAPEILFSLRVFSAFNNNLYSLFFKLVKQTTYLNACLLQRYSSIVRSKALQSVISAFCRPQDQSFKVPSSYLKDILQFDTDNDVLDFCSAHGMLLTEDGELSIGKYDFSIPSNVSSCLATSLNMIKAKRMLLPLTIAGPGGVPQEIHHKVHSSFDTDGNLNKLATNAVDQIKKLEEDFGFVVENMPVIEIDENMLNEYNKKLKQSPKANPATESNIFERLGATVSDTNKPTEFGKQSNELFKTNPFQKDGFKTNPFQKEESGQSYSNNLFKIVNNFVQNKASTDNKLFESSNIEKVSSENDSDSNLFKKPFSLPKRFSNSSSDINAFSKPSTNLFQTPSVQTNIFGKPKSDSDFLSNENRATDTDKSTEGQTLFSKSATTDVNLFNKPSTDSNLFSKQSSPSNLFKKAIAESNIIKTTSANSNSFQQPVLDSSIGLFVPPSSSSQVSSKSINIFGTKTSDEASSVPSRTNVNVFGKSSIDTGTLFSRPSSFREFMNPSKTSNETGQHNASFNFLEKVSEIRDTSPNISSGKNSGFEKSFELFLRESEQQTRKRAADDEKEEDRREEFEALQKEKEKQRQLELQLQKQRELELQKQREKELEMKRQQELELKHQREIELQKQKEIEEQRLRELEERQKALEKERLRQIELEKQKEWEMKVKQDVLNKKVEYDFQIVMKNLAKAQKKKAREHELAMIRLRKERELRKLRKIVKKKVKYIHARHCLKKWKNRVKKMKINRLDFPEVILSSIENHTAVWGSVRHITNHTPYQMRDRFENIEKLNKNPLLSSDNLYLGTGFIQVIKENLVRPRFTKYNCQFSTPLVWKVSFHLPFLSQEFSPVEVQLSEFLLKLCYDNKQSLGDCECLKSNGLTLYTSYHLVKGHELEATTLKDSNLYVFIMSELWETLEKSYARFLTSIDVLNSDVRIIILIYRSSYTRDQVLNYFNATDSISIIKWGSAADVSQSILSEFRSHFSLAHPTLCYENLYEFFSNQVEAVFLEVKLDLDIVVCTDEMLAQLRNPNYFINIYNILVSKLYSIAEQITLGSEFNTILFKDSASIVINNNPDHLETLVTTLTLPRFKSWPVLKLTKLKKLLKHFCAVIDKSGHNELFIIVMRLLNPPKENLEQYLRRVNWGNILLPCFLWNLRRYITQLNNAFLFYDREILKSELHSHWWVSM